MRFGTVAAISLLAMMADAAAEECVPAQAERVAVAEVIGAASLRLTDGRTVRLAGIAVPAAFAGAARDILVEMVAGKEVMLGNRGANPDRYGRLATDVLLPDGRHAQGELLRRGLALVMTRKDERACVQALLTAESEARGRGAGLWADPDFAIARAENPATFGARNRFQIAEGEVFSVGRTATTVYLDFGRNWATDFTVTVSGPDAALLESEGLALNDLKGRRVRVRGWLTEQNGPMIVVDHREQIEVLDR